MYKHQVGLLSMCTVSLVEMTNERIPGQVIERTELHAISPVI